MSKLAAALPVTVAELADHEARASTGDQPLSAVVDVARARQLVVTAQLRTPRSSESQRRRRRRKRSVGEPSTSTATAVGLDKIVR